MSENTNNIIDFKDWFDAVWLGDKEHGQFLPSPVDTSYSDYLESYTLAHGAWQAAIAHQNQEAVPIYQEFNPVLNAYYDCDKETYDKAITKRIVFLAPPQPQTVKDALEAAAKICDEKVKTIKANYGVSESVGADICAREIRALIKESEGE